MEDPVRVRRLTYNLPNSALELIFILKKKFDKSVPIHALSAHL